jgi:acetylornithine deacetylase/succinyl-diaminopimelate desuccinylase-like protein
MTRAAAIADVERYFDSGGFRDHLARRVAMPTESQNPERAAELRRYVDAELVPTLEALGFRCETVEEGGRPFLLAERHESDGLPTVLGYGHGDVIRGLDGMWRDGLSPWRLTERDGRYWGRGTADNKGQHGINLAAQGAVLAARGALGFNAKWLFEMGEETGSRGLREVCTAHAEQLAADVLIASDGPRLSIDRPTIFLGSRGSASFDVWIDAREGGHHSGNWGGLLSSPAIQLTHALSTLVDPSGRILIPELRPPPIPNSVRNALAGCEIVAGPGDPVIDPGWGEPGLTLAEKVFAWSAVEILAMTSGVPENPVNAIPPRAWARVQVRFVAGMDPDRFLPALRRHFDAHGFPMVQVAPAGDAVMRATRLDPEHPWVRWTAASIARTTGAPPAIIPNIGGSLPNDVFAELLGLPTVWIPHSYPGCSQHAPDEHLPVALARDALRIMTGVYWDLGEADVPTRRTAA